MPRNVNPRPQFFDDAGDPLISGKMFYFESGTSTPKTTFADVNLSIANTHPVVLTADGRLPNVFFDGTARMKLTNSADVQIWDVDPVGGENIGGNFEAWNPLVIYSINDIVEGSDGNFYISFTNGNVGNDPVSSPAFWEQSAFIRVWNTNVTYAIGDTVKASDNNFYTSLVAANQGNDPTVSPTEWGPPFTAVGTVNSGDAVTVDNTDPLNPIIDLDISKETTVVAAAGDLLVIDDVSDASNVKKVTAQTISDLAPQGDMTAAVYDPAGIAEQLVGLVAAQTLTNKTLTAPVIATISNTGVLTLPASTDTLTGKATTDVLTNKTIDADGTGNVITNIGSSEVKSEIITGQTEVVVAAGDSLIFSDVDDSGNLKRDTIQGILDLVPAALTATLDTIQTVSGTNIAFTSPISNPTEILIYYDQVKISGTDSRRIRIGPVAGIETATYVGGGVLAAPGTSAVSATNGFVIPTNNTVYELSGTITLSLIDVANNTWVAEGVLAHANGAVTIQGGSKSLAGPLTQLDNVMSGANTFSSGQINVEWRK